MFTRPELGERAILVHVEYKSQSEFRAEEENLSEFRELALSAGANIQAVITCHRDAPEPKYYIGSGKIAELADMVQSHHIDILLFNAFLTPAQERNIEQAVKARVLDRTGLILDIFARRARSHEGKLQVELAQLQHMSTRLVRGWTHLERQKGGIGLRGPGETQLETDRRLISNRIKTIKARLEKVRARREQSRHARTKVEIPSVSLVGYTNAGKSTLFNRLCDARVYAANQLFATLDPMLRRVQLPEGGNIIMADTVGFIRHLPHDLVNAFRATLEETRDATLLVHVIDTHNPNRSLQIEEVEKVLASINAETVPLLEVYNKIDLFEGSVAPKLETDREGKPTAVWLSAQTGEGIELLQSALTRLLFGDPIYRSVRLNPSDGKLYAKLQSLNAVLAERITDNGDWYLTVRLSRQEFLSLFPEEADTLTKDQVLVDLTALSL